MHERHGKLPRAVVMAPAIRLARDGFTIGPLLHRHIANAKPLLTGDPESAPVFYPNGEAIRPGERLVQRRLAEVLESIAAGGAPAFYQGELARKVAAKVRAVGGLLTADDFAAYRAEVRRPVCAPYLGYTVLGVGSPMAAHVVSEMLSLAELSGVHRRGDLTSDSAAATRMADAVRIGLADRRSYHGNPDWAPTPVRGLASRAYAESRLPLVGAPVADTLPTGDPWAFDGRPVAGACARHDPYPASDAPPMRDARPAARPGDAPNDLDDHAAETRSNTSHLSVVDADRNAVSITTSVGVLWGSGVYAEGFFLNSSGSLFDQRERAPRRKPTGLTMPILALEGDDVRLVVGAAGSAYIGAAVAQVTVRMLGLGQDPYAALAAPRFHVSPTSRTIEAEGGFALPVYAGWRAHGYLPSSRVADLQFAAVHAVLQRKDGTLIGAADPRRDGAALGY
jgi:gamma-glutamyltranspeptidase/glutathione hydrolase